MSTTDEILIFIKSRNIRYSINDLATLSDGGASRNYTKNLDDIQLNSTVSIDAQSDHSIVPTLLLYNPSYHIYE